MLIQLGLIFCSCIHERQETFMKTRNHRLIAVAVCLAFTVTAAAQEKRIERSSLPAAVEKTVQEQSKGATVKGFSTEVENGKRTYEPEMIVDGHTKDIEIAANGRLNEIEQGVDFDSLPDNVKAGLMAKAGGAKITKVETLTKNDRLVAYEAATLKGAKRGEIQVAPDGKALKHEE
jgi:uncharacterized membrane protein YkoI